jgi:protein gp37
MGDTSIQWTSGPKGEQGHTFNPWLGCGKVHAGCTHCYAERAQPVVMRAGGGVRWGEVWQGGQRVVVSESTWKKPLQWAREAARAGERRKVFCASLADVLEVPGDPPHNVGFGDEGLRVIRVREELYAARERLWDTIRQTAYVGASGGSFVPFTPTLPDAAMQVGGLDWLLLTKRPENWNLVPWDVRPLVWFGASIADQKTAEAFIPHLLSSQGFRHRFLSLEPMVGPVDLESLKISEVCEYCHEQPLTSALSLSERCGCTVEGPETISWHRLDWVIIGGESGPQARPCNLDWMRSVVEQCLEAGVACFVKQLGSAWAKSTGARMPDGKGGLKQDTHGGWPENWPAELRVRQWPNAMKGATP